MINCSLKNLVSLGTTQSALSSSGQVPLRGEKTVFRFKKRLAAFVPTIESEVMRRETAQV